MIYISSQNFFKFPFVKNNLTKVFGANQKIITEKKIKINPAVIPVLPSDEKISNIPIMLSLMRVGKIKPKIRIKKYKEVNILYALKTGFICRENLGGGVFPD